MSDLHKAVDVTRRPKWMEGAWNCPYCLHGFGDDVEGVKAPDGVVCCSDTCVEDYIAERSPT